jgi:hypothetical protein
MKSSNIQNIQKLGWLYAILFVIVASLGYIPGLTNAAGQLFGLFKLDLYDNLLHLASGIWAGLAAWSSVRASTFYFKLFGTVYGLDGVVGLIFGQGFLDGGLFLYGPAQLDWFTKIAANMPHILIGGFAVLAGFVLSRKWADQV